MKCEAWSISQNKSQAEFRWPKKISEEIKWKCKRWHQNQEMPREENVEVILSHAQHVS